MSVTAYAPASVANVFVGFDILGLAVKNLGDAITVSKTTGETRIESISGISDPIPYEITKNTAGKAILALLNLYKDDVNISIKIKKGIPLASGLGGSAASAVAAVVATNELLHNPFSIKELLDAALIGEEVASGSIHADNVAASLHGGLIAAIKGDNKYKIKSIPVPNGFKLVLLHPEIHISTKDAREALSPTVTLKRHISQNMNLVGFLTSCYEDNLKELSYWLKDDVIEPQRKHLIPGFDIIARTASKCNSIGFTISGAGPTMVACFSNKSNSDKFIKKVNELKLSYSFQVWDSEIDWRGARILEESK